ncbi:MAG: recombinase family protein [Thermaerobacter sp.]|nr:recombinase family protein [Thermaerobacter sp.]
MYNIGVERKLVRIREAAQFLGVTTTPWPRWDREGRFLPDARTKGGDRRDDLRRVEAVPQGWDTPERQTVAYARVSTQDQKDDLARQQQVLELYCARQGWTFEGVADLGSGMNYHPKSLKRLLKEILADRVFAIRAAKQGAVGILNYGEDTTFEEDLAQDVLEIITGFSARRDGSRSRKNQKSIKRC